MQYLNLRYNSAEYSGKEMSVKGRFRTKKAALEALT
jgi:hypothetical protein